MMAAGRPDIHVGDRVSLRKPHPCGCNVWLVKRVGMDVRLECMGCGRQVTMVRSDFERRYRAHLDPEAGSVSGSPHPDGRGTAWRDGASRGASGSSRGSDGGDRL